MEISTGFSSWKIQLKSKWIIRLGIPATIYSWNSRLESQLDFQLEISVVTCYIWGGDLRYKKNVLRELRNFQINSKCYNYFYYPFNAESLTVSRIVLWFCSQYESQKFSCGHDYSIKVINNYSVI